MGGDACVEYVLLPFVKKEPAFSQWFNRASQADGYIYRERIGGIG